MLKLQKDELGLTREILDKQAEPLEGQRGILMH